MSPDQAYIPRCTPTSHDLDVIGRDPDLIEAAQHACASCPMLEQCRTLIIRAGPGRTRGVIQAGEVLPDIKRPEPAERPDACRGCKQPMRPNGARAADHPGTVGHQGHGLCSTCYKQDTSARPKRVKPPSHCIDCERPIRAKGTRLADHPGSVQHAGHGRCLGCYDRHKYGLLPASISPHDLQQVITTGTDWHRLPAALRAEAIDTLHRRGVAPLDIAAHYGIHSTTVYGHLNRLLAARGEAA